MKLGRNRSSTCLLLLRPASLLYLRKSTSTFSFFPHDPSKERTSEMINQRSRALAICNTCILTTQRIISERLIFTLHPIGFLFSITFTPVPSKNQSEMCLPSAWNKIVSIPSQLLMLSIRNSPSLRISSCLVLSSPKSLERRTTS